MCDTFWETWQLVFLLLMRGSLILLAACGMYTMRRLYLRGQKLDFPIVPPSLVKLTATFLGVLFVSTVWVVVTLFTGDGRLCTRENQQVGPPNTLGRFVNGWALVFSLLCTLWIIVVGIRGYRQGPKVDKEVLDAIVEGMSQNPKLGGTG